MKKILSVLLTMLLFTGLFTINVNAVDSVKISDNLQLELTTVSDTDLVPVTLFALYPNVDKKMIRDMTIDTVGYKMDASLNEEQKHHYSNVYRELLNKEKDAKIREEMRILNLTDDDIISVWRTNGYYTEMPFAYNLTKARIEELSEKSDVLSIRPYRNYYLIGTMNDWTISRSYLLRPISTYDNYVITLKGLNPTDVFRIVESKDGESYNEETAMPENNGTYNQNKDLFSNITDEYNIVFFPNGDSGSKTYNGTIEAVYAVTTQNDGELYKERFEAYLSSRYGDDEIYNTIFKYKELYKHNDSKGAVDWVLIDVCAGTIDECWMGLATVGNRIVKTEMVGVFPFHILLYDVKKDVFINMATTKNYKPDYKEYSGLPYVLDKYCEGRLLGDIDRDNELTIIDCTLMQRCATKVRDWPDNDLIDPNGLINRDYFLSLTYYSDFDRDGERDIVDATKLQRYVTMID